MRADLPPDHVARKRVLLDLPGTASVVVRRDLPYTHDPTPLVFDLYRPGGIGGEVRVPTVVLVNGYPEPGFERMLGCKHKEMAATEDWARLLAASGLAAVAYTNRNPAEDLPALLRGLRSEADALGLDGERLGLWACSGNAALCCSTLLARPAGVRAAALLYPFTLDLDGGSDVAEVAKKFGFVAAGAGHSIDELAPELPLLLARAGADTFPGLNAACDRLVQALLARNRPFELLQLATAPHAFDLLDDSASTRHAIRRTLAFLRLHLLGADA